MRYASWWGILGAFLLAELVGWMLRFRSIGPLFEWLTHSVTALGQAGDRSAVALEQLRSTRDKVREGLEAAPDERNEPAPNDTGAIPLATAKRRFDVGDEQAGKPVRDLQEALGGAMAGTASTPGPKPMTPKEGEAAEEESVTARLLRAKKRTKREQEEQS